jgi:hypothetical protein
MYEHDGLRFSGAFSGCFPWHVWRHPERTGFTVVEPLREPDISPMRR